MVFNKKEWSKQWFKDNDDKRMINNWKYQGLICNDYQSIYKKWKESKNCENCGHDYSYYKKCMDHCHETGKFRNILCHACNVNDRSNNTSGYPNINFNKRANKWIYEKKVKKAKHFKRFKTKYEAIIYKWLYEAGYSIETN
tara:strand:- start:215 stop:637 length:423 start_codon:yes stop_codon:yes gene_type:complete